MNKTPLNPLIPEGDYCYTYTGRIRIDNGVIGYDGEQEEVDYYFIPETRPCPFWKAAGGGSAYCAYSGKLSEYEDFTNMVWDQIKECGVNVNEDLNLFEAEEQRMNDPHWVSANTRSKRYPQFIESLVMLLRNSETNELTYDNVTYTLAPHLR